METTKKKNKSKKFACIVKIGNNSDKSAKCVKYRTNDLLKFTQFIDKKYPSWTWYNVFLKETRTQIANFTKFNRPIGKDG